MNDPTLKKSDQQPESTMPPTKASSSPSSSEPAAASSDEKKKPSTSKSRFKNLDIEDLTEEELDDIARALAGPPNPRRRRIIMIVILIIFACIVGNVIFGMTQNKPDVLDTNQFVSAVNDGYVSRVVYKTNDSSVLGDYDASAFWQSDQGEQGNQSGQGNKEGTRPFKTYYIGHDSLQELMAKHRNIRFSIDTSNDDILRTGLTVIIPTILIIAAVFYLMHQLSDQNARAISFGKTHARVGQKSRPRVRFSDVAGIDEVVDELKEIRDFLKDPKRFQALGAKIPRGVLLVGAPGTGKTLIAKAVAGEAGVPFFSISGSDFVEMFVGVGASRVRDLFKQAKEAAPAIIFIDEIDAVGRQRGAGLGGGHDEREQTLNQLLVEMDGFEETDAVILIAATNRPDILDPALLRPGRFDRRVQVDPPDIEGRKSILAIHAKNKPFAEGVDLSAIAKLTPGFTGADLSNLLNEAALLAARRGKKKIGNDEVEEAMERVIAGPEKHGRVITNGEKKTIAYHESGHALVGHVLKHADPVHKITIIPRGSALGYTLQLPDHDKVLDSRNAMLDQLAVMLGGRTSEELFCDDITTGASNDLEKATKLARKMVMRYGMSDDLGAQVYGEGQHEVFLGRDYAQHSNYSLETSKRIDDEVEKLMRKAHERAREVLSARKEQMHTMVRVLIERETVDGAAAEALLDGRWDAFVTEHPEFRASATRAQDSKAQAQDSHAQDLSAQDPQTTDLQAQNSQTKDIDRKA